ncbi:hypothetical protein L873DRAFT_1841947 [Choiromyces venosus 120613-1]|uniref:Tc1-like transposase DDE domain-containing protein n=1 Tax=Choiromyces venosus 120613-1 TaxID=1336337 RepID=A0A3N4JYF2_9PEZI|nr:hypothetical protein L873DRAFT_1841947 [Choiromyces venosus 120613-1]
MLWGAITYGVACKNSIVFIWNEETEQEKEAVEILAEENSIVEATTEKLYPIWYAEEMMVALGEYGGRRKVWLMGDGAGLYHSKHLNNYHHEHGINKTNWPASTLDLNPIEQVWDYIH